MKRIFAVALAFAATGASADEAFSLAEIQMNQSLSGSGTTVRAGFSTGYNWGDRFQTQGDVSLSRADEDSHFDFAFAVHGGYELAPELTVGGYLGLENAPFGPGDAWFHGLEAAVRNDVSHVQVFATRNGGPRFPGAGNVEAGGQASFGVTNRLSLVGSAVMGDNDDDDHVTFTYSGGVDYLMNNGAILNAELVLWEQRVNWNITRAGTGLTAGFKYNLDQNQRGFQQRSSIATFFGNEFRGP
jgi:hypothetical protein